MAQFYKKHAPLFLSVPALCFGIGMLIPFLYLAIRAFDVDISTLKDFVFRFRTFLLFRNTIALTLCVCLLSTLIAVPVAWLVVCTDIKYKKILSFLSVLPLAIPGYVMAFALIGLGGYYGFMYQFFGIRFTRPEGLLGATLALSLYIYPYMFLHVRSALRGLDPSLIETARSFGYSQWEITQKVVLPHLFPSLVSGWFVIGLYTLGDFGAVALMRYDVFSSAIYNQYANGFERHYASLYALMLLSLSGIILWLDSSFSRKRDLARTGTGVRRPIYPIPLGKLSVVAWCFLALVHCASLILPATAIIFWLSYKHDLMQWKMVWDSSLHTAVIAIPSAALAVLVALPVATLVTRYPSRKNALLDRIVYFCYAVPPLPFALAVVFFSLTTFPFIYQTLFLLMLSYALSFAALAMGPIKSRLLQSTGRLEEAARSLGYTQAEVFTRITLPFLQKSLLSGWLMVFLVIVKELPLVMLLSPSGYKTLAINVFHRTEEGMLVDAAPYALLMVLFSGVFVGLTIIFEEKK